jgi:hypothetical protein
MRDFVICLVLGALATALVWGLVSVMTVQTQRKGDQSSIQSSARPPLRAAVVYP